MNSGKVARLEDFISEYRRAANLYLDFLWNNDVSFNGKVFSICRNLLETPLFLKKGDYPNFPTNLSARALKCCLTQVLGAVRSSVEKSKRRLYVLNKIGQPEILNGKITKPCVGNMRPELNSVCADFQLSNGEFDGFLQLKSLGKSFGKIRIPVKFHRQFLKWRDAGKMRNSFLISGDNAEFRFEIKGANRPFGETVGADQGLKTVLTLSDGQATLKENAHGHSLESIVDRLARKKKGSNGFKRAQDLRRNFIGWSINRLNFGNIRQINLEDVRNINFGKRASRKMQAWTNTGIRDKLIRLAEEREVFVKLQPSAYKSQRCSACGNVRKSNRKGEKYACKGCGTSLNADFNAALNHSQDLPPIPFGFFKKGLNLGDGFLWKPEGFFDLSGAALTVPRSETKDLCSRI